MSRSIVEIVYSLIDQVSAKADRVAKSLEKIEQSSGKAGAEQRKLNRAVADVDRDLTSAALVTGGMAAGLGALAKASVNAAEKMEDQRVALTTLMGSARRADMVMKDVIKTAEKTPFEATELLGYVIQLKNANIAQKDLIPTMLMLGDVASGVGKDKLPQIVLAYTQILAAGKLLGNNMNQLADAQVPIVNELSKVLGVPVAKVFELKEQSKISADVVMQAFQNMTSAGGQFNNAMNNASLTSTGLRSTLTDVFTQLQISMGTGLLPAVKVATKGITELLRLFMLIPASVRSTIGAFLVATTTTLVLMGAYIGLTAAIGGVQIALLLLTKASLVGLVVSAVVLAIQYWEKLKIILYELMIPIQAFNIAWLKIINQIEGAFDRMVLGMINKLKELTKAVSGIFGLKVNIQPTMLPAKGPRDDEIAYQEGVLARMKKNLAKQKAIKESGVQDDAEIARIKQQIDAEALAAEQKRLEAQKAMADADANAKAEAEQKEADKKQKMLEAEASKKVQIARQEMAEQAIIKGEQDIQEMTYYDRIKEYMGGVLARRREIDAITIEERIAHEQKLLEIENLSKDEKEQIEANIGTMKAQKTKAEADAKQKATDNMLNLAEKVANNEVSVGEAAAEGLFGIKKDQVIADMKLKAAELMQTGQALLTASMFTNPLGWAHLAGGAALFAGGIAAANAIKLADGGIVMPRVGGTPAIIGEAGQPEAVIPLNSPQAQDMMQGGGPQSMEVMVMTVDGEMLTRGIAQIENRMIRSGKITKVEFN